VTRLSAFYAEEEHEMSSSKWRLTALLSLLASLAAALLLSACGSSSSPSESVADSSAPEASQVAETDTNKQGETSQPSKYTIGWVPPVVAPFEEVLRQGMKLQAAKLGMSVAVAGGKLDPGVQISAVDALVQRGVDALIIWPLDKKAIQPALERASDSNIPVITIEGQAAASTAVNFEATTFESAKETAEAAAELIAEEGRDCKVGIIEGLPIYAAARNEGFEKGVENTDCEILERQVNTTSMPDKAAEITTAWKTKFGSDMTVILALNDPSALAAAALVNSEFDPLIFGANGDPEAIEAIEEGRLAGTQSSPSPNLGNGVAYAAHQLILSKPVPKKVKFALELVTQENVGEYISYEERLEAPQNVSIEGAGAEGTLVTELVH